MSFLKRFCAAVPVYTVLYTVAAVAHSLPINNKVVFGSLLHLAFRNLRTWPRINDRVVRLGHCSATELHFGYI